MTRTAVRDAMTREVYSVRKSTPIPDITRILAGRGISAVPVVDNDRDVVGVVSEADLLLKQVETPPSGHARLPVVDRYGKLTGIVSRADLGRAFVRTDTEIRDEVDRDILEIVRRPSQGVVVAEVTDGIVTLRGKVERRSQAVLLDALVRRVAGVVDVVDRVDFAWNDEVNGSEG